MTSVNTNYRADIDGLRAVAIIPVIAFHIWPDVLPNGYLGVDVFFVISGFLIYSILLRDFEADKFSFKKFWTRRLKRLYPAVSVLSITCLVMGYFILQREEWKSLAEQTIAAFTCSANIYMWQNANNYWGESSATMPFLHMWSLAVEEQFYIVFPIALYFFFRFYRRDNRLHTLLLVHCLLFVASFLLWIYGTSHHRSAGFYLLPFRAWQILAGCCVGILTRIRPIEGSKKWIGRWLPDVGLCVVLAIFIIDDDQGHQSPIMATLCCLGAVLNLFRDTTQPATAISRLLQSAPFVVIGRSSYSLYLWHWPIIVLSFKVMDVTGVQLLTASLLMGAASYYVVENKTRSMANRPFKAVFVMLTVSICAALSLPYWVSRPAVNYDIPELMLSISLTPDNNAKVDEFSGDYKEGLLLADQDQISQLDVLILGDSHSVMFFPAVKLACERLNASLGFYGAASGTSPFFVQNGRDPAEYSVMSWTDEQRLEFDKNRHSFINRYRPHLIIVCAKWSSFGVGQPLADLQQHLENLVSVAPRAKFLFVLQPPELPIGGEHFGSGNLELPLLRRVQEEAGLIQMRRIAHEVVKSFAENKPQVSVVETENLFTSGSAILLRDARTMFYWDNNHLSVSGAMRCVNLFESAISKQLVSNDGDLEVGRISGVAR